MLMKKDSFKIIICLVIVLLLVGGFIAYDYYKSNLQETQSATNQHTPEPLPVGEPHTADEVVDVHITSPTDENGNAIVELVQQKVPYVVEVDLYPVLFEQKKKKKELIIMSQKATASQTAKKKGLWSLPVFKQTQAILFHGEVTYTVDLSSLSPNDFMIDKDNKTITITIPKPKLSVKLLQNETEFFDSSNGILRFGQMEISAEDLTELQNQGIQKITEDFEADKNNWETVERFAKLSVKEIYEPLIAAQVDAAVKNANDEFAIPAYYSISVVIKDK